MGEGREMKMRTLLIALFVCAIGCEKSLETVSRAQTVEENTEAQNSLQIRYQYDGEWKTKSLSKEPIFTTKFFLGGGK